MKIRSVGALMAALAVIAAMATGTTLRSDDGKQDSTPWGKSSEGFRLSARVEKKEFRIGEPIVLKLTLKNITKKTLYVMDRFAERDYMMVVENEQGEPATLTPVGQHLLVDNAGEDFRVKAYPSSHHLLSTTH